MTRRLRLGMSILLGLLLQATLLQGAVLGQVEYVSIADIPEIVGDGAQTCELDADSLQEAIDVRGRIGLSTNPAKVRATFESPLHVCTAFGVPLTPDEASAFVRVLNAQAELSDLAGGLADSPTFGGAHLEGSRLIVTSTDGRLGEGARSSRGSIELRRGDFTFAHLEAVAEEITETVRDGTAEERGVDLTLVTVDPRTNRVQIGVAADVKAARSEFEAKYGGAVSVELVVPEPGEHFCTKNDCGTKGGLVIKKGSLTCTSGFLVKARKNNGAWSRYMLTAGHCIHDTGGIASTASWKNGAGTTTWGRSQGHSFWEWECEGWTHCWDNDLGLFALGGNVPATRNEYFIGGGSVAITGSKTKANQLVGQTVWRHGTTSGLGSAAIAAKPNFYAYSCFPHTCKHFNVVKVGHGSAKGDSGSGYYRMYTQDGITKRDAYGILSLGPPGGSETYYYAWNEYFDDDSNDVCDVWEVQPCTSGTCPLT
jgi:hypothetical protein